MSNNYSVKTYNRVPLWGKVSAWALIIFYAVLTIAPLLFLLMSSMKPASEIMRDVLALPIHPTFANFTRAWDLGHFGYLFYNSVFYAVITTFVVVFLSLATAYAFAFIHSKWTKYLYGFIMIGLLITVQSTLIPLYIMETFLHLDSTKVGVLLPYIAFALPFAIYLAVTFIKDIPSELFDAAKMDGATHLQTLTKIVFPISVPIAITIAIFTFLGSWNEFILVYTLTRDVQQQSLPVGLNVLSGGRTPDMGLIYASLVITTVPMIIFYAFFQKQLHSGFAGGAVKG